jgi:hypothetical protein
MTRPSKGFATKRRYLRDNHKKKRPQRGGQLRPFLGLCRGRPDTFLIVPPPGQPVPIIFRVIAALFWVRLGNWSILLTGANYSVACFEMASGLFRPVPKDGQGPAPKPPGPALAHQRPTGWRALASRSSRHWPFQPPIESNNHLSFLVWSLLVPTVN